MAVDDPLVQTDLRRLDGELGAQAGDRGGAYDGDLAEPEAGHEPVGVARAHARSGHDVADVLLLRPGDGGLHESGADAVPTALVEHVHVQDVHRLRRLQRHQRGADEVDGTRDLTIQDRDDEPLVGVGGDPGDGCVGLAGGLVHDRPTRAREDEAQGLDVLQAGVADRDGAAVHGHLLFQPVHRRRISMLRAMLATKPVASAPPQQTNRTEVRDYA